LKTKTPKAHSWSAISIVSCIDLFVTFLECSAEAHFHFQSYILLQEWRLVYVNIEYWKLWLGMLIAEAHFPLFLSIELLVLRMRVLSWSALPLSVLHIIARMKISLCKYWKLWLGMLIAEAHFPFSLTVELLTYFSWSAFPLSVLHIIAGMKISLCKYWKLWLGIVITEAHFPLSFTIELLTYFSWSALPFSVLHIIARMKISL